MLLLTSAGSNTCESQCDIRTMHIRKTLQSIKRKALIPLQMVLMKTKIPNSRTPPQEPPHKSNNYDKPNNQQTRSRNANNANKPHKRRRGTRLISAAAAIPRRPVASSLAGGDTDDGLCVMFALSFTIDSY
jgi:hypothetical protein